MTFPKLLLLLKKHLKAKKLTYRDLGAKIGMSESAVKKLFNGADCSFNRLSSICDVLGLSMSEILAASEEVSVTRVTIAPDVQEYFRAHRDCFNFFWLLNYERISVSKIKDKLSLSTQQIENFCVELSRMGFSLPNEFEASRYSPSIVLWKDNGAFAGEIKREWASQVLGEALSELPSRNVRNHFFLGSLILLPQSYDDFTADLNDLLEVYHRRSAHEVARNSGRTEHFRVLAASVSGSFVKNETNR